MVGPPSRLYGPASIRTANNAASALDIRPAPAIMSPTALPVLTPEAPMHRSALALVGCVALALAAGCGPRSAPVRTVTTTGPGTYTRPKAKSPALRYKKPEAAGILGAGIVGAATHPLTLACYADFALDTADLLDLAPRYERPVIAGVLGGGLSGTGAAGPLHQLVYADVAASSFDQLGTKPPAAKHGGVLFRKAGRLDRRELERSSHPLYVSVQVTSSRTTTGTAARPKGATTTRPVTRPTTRPSPPRGRR
jgi:hypothetical protein